MKYYLFALQNANTCEANQADYSHKGIFIDKEDSLCQHSSSVVYSENYFRDGLRSFGNRVNSQPILGGVTTKWLPKIYHK